MILYYFVGLAILFENCQPIAASVPKPPAIPPPVVCKTVENKTCHFPFLDGKTLHNKCAPHTDKFWCAVTVKADNSYDAWGYCNPKTCSAQENVSTSSCITPTNSKEHKPNTRALPDKFEHKGRSHKWTQYWDSTARIPILSQFFIYGGDWKFAKDEISIHRGDGDFFEPAGFSGTNVPIHTDYDNTCGYQRGHLLSSEFIRTFTTIPRSTTICKAYVQDTDELQRSILNIFPQQQACNIGGVWKIFENQYVKDAKACLRRKNHFVITHAVHPSTTNFKSTIKIPNEIIACYSCSSSTTTRCEKFGGFTLTAGCYTIAPTAGISLHMELHNYILTSYNIDLSLI